MNAIITANLATAVFNMVGTIATTTFGLGISLSDRQFIAAIIAADVVVWVTVFSLTR